MRRETDR
jgi:phenylalanyl-tRNA synthetase alpha chain